MATMTWFARITIDSHEIAFETACAECVSYLRRLGPTFFSRFTYEYAEATTGSTGPSLCYRDAGTRSMSYDAANEQLTASAPWSSVPGSTLLEMSLWLLIEVDRQKAGRFLLHGSAVVRDGDCVVITAPSEGGKTTLALDLCLKHGFTLLANDQVLVGLETGEPTVIRGDAFFNLRLSSLLEYSPELAKRVFGGTPENGDPARIKKIVDPISLGVQAGTGPFTITRYILVKLEPGARKLVWSDLALECDYEAMFLAKIAMFEELSRLIRGSGFTPLDERLDLVDVFIPSLDSPALVRSRVQFIRRLFTRARVIRIRGTLRDSVEFLLAQNSPEPVA